MEIVRRPKTSREDQFRILRDIALNPKVPLEKKLEEHDITEQTYKRWRDNWAGKIPKAPEVYEAQRRIFESSTNNISLRCARRFSRTQRLKILKEIIVNPNRLTIANIAKNNDVSVSTIKYWRDVEKVYVDKLIKENFNSKVTFEEEIEHTPKSVIHSKYESFNNNDKVVSELENRIKVLESTIVKLVTKL